MTARIAVSIIFANGVGPDEIPLLDLRGEPDARSLVRDMPSPPDALDRTSTSPTDLAMWSISSCTSMRKQFDRGGLIVPAARFVEPPAMYSCLDIFV